MHILGNAQSPYLLAVVTALLQLRTMFMTSSPGLVQLIPTSLKARSAHVRPPPLFYTVYGHRSLPVLFTKPYDGYISRHIPTYTYISLSSTKFSYIFINSHLILTMHILDNAQALYLYTC